MATFAEFPPHTMASNNDFTLYPYPDVWNQEQTLLPTSTFHEQTYLNATSFQATHPFAHPDQFSFTNDQPFLHKQHLHPPSPKYSPTHSASHSFDLQNPPVLSSTSDSGASVQSTVSSAIGSPSAHPQPAMEWAHHANLGMMPNIVQHDHMSHDVFATTGFDMETITVTEKGCVDPALIQPTFSPTQFTGFADATIAQSPQNMVFSHPSPAPSQTAIHSPRQPVGKISGSVSPYMRTHTYQPYPTFNGSRRQSISSAQSPHSQGSLSSEDSNKGLCPIATCGRHVKDLKAHMLTHQNERPEKCPIPTCEYHVKGFARKYDKNRHTLTHYKGTMVCGFCPGSGSAAEKSFNRADVFKRHLTSVHNVEQTPPNARRKSPGAAGSRKGYGGNASGMCSTCGVTFANPQDFYEHLDDCVLRVVQQADPGEAINQKLLTSIADDAQVQETMEKHMLPCGVDFSAPTSFDDEEEGDEDEDADEDDTNDTTYGSRNGKSGKGGLRSRKNILSGQSTHPRGVVTQHVGGGNHISSGGAVSKPQKKGLTVSKNGVPLNAMSGKGSKRRKNYPLSWGAAPEKMKMRKRVMCVYDGQRRLWKDDMMLDADHEVRIPLNNEVGVNRAWVSDLDVQTLRRADALHNMTEEEKGPWLQDDDELERLMA